MKKQASRKLKVGVFGGSFNPLHLGHVHLLKQVYKELNLDLIKVVPAFKAPDISSIKFPTKPPATTPLSKSFTVREPTPKQRLAVVRKALKSYPFLEVDDREIKREGVSYTINTIEEIIKENPHFKEIFLIIGADQFVQFNKWKRYKTLLKRTNLVVCSRKNYLRSPTLTRELTPPSVVLSARVVDPVVPSDGDATSVVLPARVVDPSTSNKAPYGDEALPARVVDPSTSNKAPYGDEALPARVADPSVRKIHWMDLKGKWDISSSEVRERVGQGLPVQKLIPSLVHQWISQKGFYQKKIKEKDLIKFCAQTLLEKKAEKIKMFDLRKFSALPFDFTLMASGLNTQHTKVLALHLGRQVKKEFSLSTWNKEGEKTGEWIVLDYGFLGVHIFYHYTREHYQLEELWKTAPTKTF